MLQYCVQLSRFCDLLRIEVKKIEISKVFWIFRIKLFRNINIIIFFSIHCWIYVGVEQWSYIVDFELYIYFFFENYQLRREFLAINSEEQLMELREKRLKIFVVSGPGFGTLA